MAEALLFEDREAFRAWLTQTVEGPGAWLAFGKKGGPRTLTAAQALEEALCFGWVDGQMESVDAGQYRKYFAPRRPRSRWSPKNRALAERLIAEGRMTAHGLRAIEEAKENGGWDAPARLTPTQADIDALAERLAPHAAAYANFMAMTPSARRTYAGFCMDVKSPEAGARRFTQLVERLELNLGPMDSLKKAARP